MIPFLVLLAAPVSGQVAFDAPSLIGPASPMGLAIYLTSSDPGDGLGGLATWRQSRGRVDVGYRVSVGQGADSDLAFGGGIDVSGVLSRGLENSEIDVLWWTGVGAGIGDDVMVSVPLGIVAGWTGEGDDVVFSPYLGGHIALDFTSIDGDELVFGASLDIGMDLELTSGWVIRFGLSLGGRDALAFGMSLPSGSGGTQN
jgi:hypothetical protein